ncbi:diguanylate cyclase [Aquihabitans daechungensis]|uniref:GGDEF domain-containing protein n=1 Tax=Aquihabitans daechungensis TaxID=1052257 RepID=UPI003B9E8683
MRTERRSTAIERDRAIWRTYARTGHLLNVLVLVIDTAYVLGTWNSGSHRPLLLGLNLAALVGVVAAYLVVPETKVAASPRRDLIFAGWVLIGVALVTVAAGADGGVHSPLAWLLPISVMFTAVAHRPAMVWLAGSFAMVGYAILTVTSPGAAGPAATLARLGYLAVLTFAAASAARSRWDHHDAQAEAHAELSLLADLDGLTGVLNHRAFHEQLAIELAECDRRSLRATLLLIDLDHFKAINDRYGHGIGDDVLREVSAVIVLAVRAGDIVGRVGGEEFAVCLGATSTSEAHRIAERVRAAVAEISDPEPITASIGIGTTDTEGPIAADLLGRADEALYLAKHQGRNRTCGLRVA